MSINSDRRAAGITDPAPSKTFTQDEVNTIVKDRLERHDRGRVVEPRIYAADSPYSFYADMYLAGVDKDASAIQRRTQHEREIAYEASQGSPEGRRAEKVIRNSFRSTDEGSQRDSFERAMVELRAFVSGGGPTVTAGTNAAAFVPPFFLNDGWASWRGRKRSFADQCQILPMPAYGLHVYIPAFATTEPTGGPNSTPRGGPEAGLQTEGSAVKESSTVSASLEGGEVSTAAGRLTLTQQLIDRAFGSGGNYDRIIFEQLQQQVEEQVDQVALNAVISAGKSITSNFGTWKPTNGESLEKWYEDLAKSREELSDTEGLRLRATHFFSSTDFYNFITRQFDNQHRPIVVPQYVPGVPPIPTELDSQDAPKWSRFTGTVLPGGQLWFTDDNLPLSGTTKNINLLTSAPYDAVTLLEDDAPTTSLFLESNVASELKVILTERKYAAAVTRRAGGTAVISGTSYYESLK